MEVLNISNVNSRGDIVFNDERFLELLQQYPFLFNASLPGYQDPDYSEWAWERIVNVLNKHYDSTTPNVPFCVLDLQRRWQILKPIILRLSKVCDMTAIPDSLLKNVLNIVGQLDEPAPSTGVSPAKDITYAQGLVLENVNLIEKLPLPERRRLETELMELILSAELDSNATKKTDAVDMQAVERDCETFFNILCLKDLEEMAKAEPKTPVKPTPVKCEEALLEPLPPKHWIPLDQARFYVRKCKVRIKRIRTDEEIPLASIKKIKKERNINYSTTGSDW